MIHSIIVDDEPSAITILKEYVEKVSFLKMTASFRDPLEALEFCQQNRVDLILLDINMPNLNGLQFYKALKEQPPVIFTTAYSEFAVESYELNATDYLLKPVSFARFVSAVGKVLEKPSGSGKSKGTLQKDQDVIYVKSGHQLHRIDTNDILFLEKDGHYLVFHTRGKKVLSRMNMKQAFDIVSEKRFVQVHKSFIVAWNHIDVFDNYQIIINKHKIPIGVSYRKDFQRIVGKTS